MRGCVVPIWRDTNLARKEKLFQVERLETSICLRDFESCLVGESELEVWSAADARFSDRAQLTEPL